MVMRNWCKALFHVGIPIIILCVSLTAAQADEKWLVYTKVDSSWPAGRYVGHLTSAPPDLNDYTSVINSVTAGKPIIDERDIVHVLVYVLPAERDLLFKVTESEYKQPPDGAIVPPTRQGQTSSASGITSTGVTGFPLVLDLYVKEKGGIKITYQLIKKATPATLGPPPTPATPEEIKLEDTIRIHSVYRFRIMAGPVYTTLKKRQKKFRLTTDSLGNKVVSSTEDSDMPFDIPLFLKIYLVQRDVLVDPPLWQRVNPVVGINLIESPFKNLYAGISVEAVRGVDIVGGVHVAKITHLTGGFFEGQVTSVSPATRERFDNGWFAGVAVDLGVVATWLKAVKTIAF